MTDNQIQRIIQWLEEEEIEHKMDAHHNTIVLLLGIVHILNAAKKFSPGAYNAIFPATKLLETIEEFRKLPLAERYLWQSAAHNTTALDELRGEEIDHENSMRGNTPEDAQRCASIEPVRAET